MFKPDSTSAHGRTDVPPTAGVLPPPLPAPPQARGGLSALAITAICVVAVGTVLAAGVLVVVVFNSRIFAKAGQSRAQPTTSQPRPAVVPQAAPMETRPVKSAPTQSIDGVSYYNEKLTAADGDPWSVHVLKIERARKDLGFFTAHAREKVLGVSLLRDQARAIPGEFGRAVAVINGDFYDRDNATYAGDPRGLQILNGELISAPDTVCMWFDAEEKPHLDEVKGLFYATWPDGRKTTFGLNERRRPGAATLYTPTYGPSTRATGGRELILEKDGDGPWLPLQVAQSYRALVREISTTGNTPLAPGIMVLSFAPNAALPDVTPGTTVQISTGTTPNLAGIKMAIGGGPTLIKDGKLAFTSTTAPPGVSGDWSQRSKYERHPRSAIGWSATHIYFIVVDGRQPGLSMGMKLAELGQYFAKLGCTEAMNLDGGKSAQLLLGEQIMNSPCQGEDTVANAIVVLRKPERR